MKIVTEMTEAWIWYEIAVVLADKFCSMVESEVHQWPVFSTPTVTVASTWPRKTSAELEARITSTSGGKMQWSPKRKKYVPVSREVSVSKEVLESWKW